MKLLLRVSPVLCTFALAALLQGCTQPDNPTPTAAPPPPAPKQTELQLPKKQGKAFDPASNPRYKAFEENMKKQSGS